MARKLLPVLFFLFMQLAVFAQQSGTPFITNFTTDTYKASKQNWAAVQDQRGILYFANNDGILEYDGVTWRLINIGAVRTLAIDSTERIYVGQSGDLGFFPNILYFLNPAT